MSVVVVDAQARDEPAFEPGQRVIIGESADEDAAARVRGFRIARNADGSAIVKLIEPIMLKSERGQLEPHDRLTIPRITGRHLKSAGWTITGQITLAHLAEFASAVLEPRGAFDELPPLVARDVAMEIFVALGKPPGSRAGASP